MTKETQAPWPPTRESGTERRAPRAFFTQPDGYLKSERSLAGPLRMGTAPGVGPQGAAPVGNSDFGVDRVTPRRFDPMGSHNVRAPAREESTPLSRELRNSNRNRKDR